MYRSLLLCVGKNHQNQPNLKIEYRTFETPRGHLIYFDIVMAEPKNAIFVFAVPNRVRQTCVAFESCS